MSPTYERLEWTHEFADESRFIYSELDDERYETRKLISTSTVKKLVRRIISKLGVSDRTQAAVQAIELGLHLERNGH